MRQRWFIALAVVAFAMAACGGGGSGGGSTTAGSIVPSSATTPTPAATSSAGLASGYANTRVTITYTPATAAAKARRPQTVGTGTNSIAFTLLEQNGAPITGGTPEVFGLTATSPGCTQNANQTLTCILNLAAPVGADIYLAQTYTGTSGVGAGSTLTGSGAVALTVVQNASNSANISLTGQVASAYVATSGCYLGLAPYSCDYIGYDDDAVARRPAGVRRVLDASTVTSMRVFVIALDSAQNIILNPSQYDQPITLQLIYLDYTYTPALVPVPDVQLTDAYALSACGGNATTTANYGTINVCSPSDVITASLVDVASGSPGAIIFASVGTAGILPSPAPSTTPAPLPATTPANGSYVQFPVTVTMTPTPTPPTPTPTATPALTWASQATDPRFTAAYQYYVGYSVPATFTFVSLTDTAGLLDVTASGPAYTGGVTFTGDTTCATDLIATPAFGTSVPYTNGTYPVTLGLNAPTAPFTCTVTATENGSTPAVTVPLTVSANQYSLSINAKGRTR
jgi:hypothetical protein